MQGRVAVTAVECNVQSLRLLSIHLKVESSQSLPYRWT